MANVDGVMEVGELFLVEEQKLYVRVTIHQILNVDLHEETFSMEFDVFFRWRDPRLRNWSTRLWLPEGSAKVEGEKESNGSAIRKPGRWNDLRYVEGIFRESSDGDKIKVDGLEEQTVPAYLFKEEPDFDDFGKSKLSTVVSFAKIMEEPLVLNEHVRIVNGNSGEVVWFRKMRGCFKENMEVKRFPFDRQLLQFTMTATVPTKILTMEVDRNLDSLCRVKDLSEYTVDEKEQKQCTLARREEGTKSAATRKCYSQLKVTICLQRKPHKYLVNIGVMIYILVLSSFGCFIISLDNPGERLSIIITFVLTIMALKYVINDQLPGKDYQTFVDKYLLGAYIFLTAPAIELLLLKVPDTLLPLDGLDLAHIDVAFAAVLFIVWNTFHAVLALVFICKKSWLYLDWEKVRKEQDDPTRRGWSSVRDCGTRLYHQICRSESDREGSV